MHSVYVMSSKLELKIGRLNTINEILDLIPFIGYSTQKRNLAYLIQLKQLLQQIYNNYEINKGLRTIYRYNMLRCSAYIIEALLFCAMRQIKGFEIQAGKGKAMKLINAAKGLGLIKKETAQKAKKVIDYRNNFHPDKQAELHTKIDMEIFDELGDSINILLNELKDYFWPKPGK